MINGNGRSSEERFIVVTLSGMDKLKVGLKLTWPVLFDSRNSTDAPMLSAVIFLENRTDHENGQATIDYSVLQSHRNESGSMAPP